MGGSKNEYDIEHGGDMDNVWNNTYYDIYKIFINISKILLLIIKRFLYWTE